MKIALIGASGFVGSAILNEAVSRGHSVTAIARDPSRLQGREGVSTVALDVTRGEGLEQAVAGHDVVLSAAHFATVAPQQIIEPVKRAGVKRLLVVGGAGSLLLPSGQRVIDSPDFPEAYKAEATAGGVFLEALRAISKALRYPAIVMSKPPSPPFSPIWGPNSRPSKPAATRPVSLSKA